MRYLGFKFNHFFIFVLAGGILGAAFFVSTSASGGASVEFNGTNSILVAPSSPSLALTSDFTLEAWVKILQEPAPNQSYILVSKWEPLQNQRSYMWRYQKTLTGNKILELCTSSAGTLATAVCRGVSSAVTPLADLGVNEWHHVAARFNNTNPGQAAIFVDGQNLGGGVGAPLPAAHDNPFTIGAGRAANGVIFFPCNCRMDEMRVWNVGRSEMEIIRDRAKELTGNEPNLAGYWRFNNDFKDSSPNHNDLTPTNVLFSPDSAPLEPALNLVLFGKKEVKIEKESQVSSGNIASNDNLDIEKDAIVNGDLLADKITIDKNTVINGNASYNKLKTHKDVQILGTKTLPLSLPLFTLPPVPDFRTGNQDFKFNGQDNVLVPGSYRDITVEKGSRLTIFGGIYNLSSLILKDSATLLLEALEVRTIDNFENLALGQLKNQNGWIFSSTTTPNFVVQNEVVSEGQQAVKGWCTAPCHPDQVIGKSIPGPTNVARVIEPITDTTNFTTISFDFRVDSGSSLVVATDRTFRQVFILHRNLEGDFFLTDGIGSQSILLLSNSQPGIWYHFDVHVDLENRRVQARINNGPWSLYTSSITPVTSIDHLHLNVGASPIPLQVDTTAYFDNIYITVEKPSPAIVNIQRELKGQERVAVVEDAGLTPQDLIINYIGRNTKAEIKANKKGADGGVKPVEFDKNSFLNFKLFAPEASVHIGQESTLRGQVLARKIKIEKGSVVSREQTTIKIAKPEDIITDPGGGVYPVNELLVSLIPGATELDAQNIAASINGRIVGVVASINLYQIEVQTRTVQELENLINTLRASPQIDGVFRNFVSSEHAFPFYRKYEENFFRKMDNNFGRFIVAVEGILSTMAAKILLLVVTILAIAYLYWRREILARGSTTFRAFVDKLFYTPTQFLLFFLLAVAFSVFPISSLPLSKGGYVFGIPFEVVDDVWGAGIPYVGGFSVIGFLGNTILAYIFVFMAAFVKINFKTHKIKSFIALLAFLILLAASLFVTLLRLGPLVSPEIFSSFISTVHAQGLIKYDLQNLRNQDQLLTKAYDNIHIQAAWDKIKDSNKPVSALTVGIVDTGAERNHREFNNPNVKLGSFSNILSDFEVSGHGTQVAGIIGANNVLGRGGTLDTDSPQMNGILSGVLNEKENQYTLEIQPYVGPLSATKNSLIGVFAALERAIVSNSQIINLSFGIERCSDLSLIVKARINECVNTDEEFVDIDKKYREIFEDHPEVLFVASAGNEDVDSSLITPARNSSLPSNNVISVGATDLNDNRADFLYELAPGFKSNFGTSVNISAPGKNVYAPMPGNAYDKPAEIAGVVIGGFSGTSASAPMVTGVAGLIKAIKPELTPAQIKQILVETGDSINTDKPIGPRLNAEKAVCHSLVLNCPPPPPPPPPAAPIWPMFQKDAQRSGFADVAGPPFATSTEVSVKWQKSSAHISPLIGGDGTVYYVDFENKLTAVDDETGAVKWQASIPGGAFSSALGPDGTIYVCSNSSIQGTLSAFEPVNGQKKWDFVVGGPTSCQHPVVASDGTIYTSVPPPFNAQTAIVVAINPDGTQKWRHEETNTVASPPALSNDGSQLYVALRNRLLAFNSQTGQILWTQTTPLFRFDLPVVDAEDRIFIVSPPSFGGGPAILHAFTKSGAPLWNINTFGLRFIALAPDNKIVAVHDSVLRLVDRTSGAVISTIPLLSGFVSASHPIVDINGVIYLIAQSISTLRHRLVAFDAGGLRWGFEIPSLLAGGKNGIAFSSEGMLYFSTRGTLTALGL